MTQLDGATLDIHSLRRVAANKSTDAVVDMLRVKLAQLERIRVTVHDNS